MKNNRTAAIIAFITIAFTAAILMSSQDRTSVFTRKSSVTPTPEIHYHAGFRIYKDGKLQDFTKLEFMSIKPCAIEPGEEHEETEADMLHLHDGVGDVVHIHGAGRKWGHLFTYLKLETPQTITAYSGASQVTHPLDTPIQKYQSVIFFIGDEPANKAEIIATPISKQYIQEAEKRSENCGS